MKKELKGKKIPLVVWMQVIHRDLSRSNHLHYQLTNQYLTKQKDAALQATAKAAEGDKKTKKEGDQKKPEKEDCTFEHTLRLAVKCSGDMPTIVEKYAKNYDTRWLQPLTLLLGVSLEYPGQCPKKYMGEKGEFKGMFGVYATIAAFDCGMLPHLVHDLSWALQAGDKKRAWLILGLLVNFGIHPLPIVHVTLRRLRVSNLVTFVLNSSDEPLKKVATVLRDHWKMSKSWTEPRCDNETCGKETTSSKVCSRCRNALYCSPECQKKCWKAHKKTCKPAPSPSTPPTTETAGK